MNDTPHQKRLIERREEQARSDARYNDFAAELKKAPVLPPVEDED